MLSKQLNGTSYLDYMVVILSLKVTLRLVQWNW